MKRCIGLLTTVCLLTGAARADEHERQRGTPLLNAYVQECGACHIAYPPGMLPPATWRRQMAGLDKHYGVNASLEAREAGAIRAWLLAHGGEPEAGEAAIPEARITRTGWFVHEHRHIEAGTWRLPSVRSAANCVACHAGAAEGRFSEHELRMPAGLSARQRMAWDD